MPWLVCFPLMTFRMLARNVCTFVFDGRVKNCPVVLARILSEEVKSVLDVRYPGFLFREFQPSFLEECHDEGFDFNFQYLF